MSNQENFRWPEKPLEKARELIAKLEYQRKLKCKENALEIRSGQLCETSS